MNANRAIGIRILLAGALLLLLGSAAAHAQNIRWTRQFGTSGQDEARAISVDASGVYVAGIVNRPLPFEPISDFGDAFVRKYDTAGNEVWTRQFGTSDADGAFAISVDPSGVYVAGFTHGTLPGQTRAGGGDAFVRKYDTAGNEVWTRQFGNSSFDEALAISVDASGVYVAGRTFVTLPGQCCTGFDDAFVRKYDADGNEIWTRQFGTSRFAMARAISVNASGVYVAGSTDGALLGQPHAGFRDAFVRKYDADGNEIWTRQFGTSGDDDGQAISVDASGVYVAGSTNGILPDQTEAGGLFDSDAFVRKYDTAGNEVWTRQFGTSSHDSAFGISVDASGVYVAGAGGALPGQTSAGSGDAFVRKYDTAGNEVWTRQFGSSAADLAFAISVDASKAYVVGFTDGTLPGQTSAGGRDAFVVSLTQETEMIQQLVQQIMSLNLRQGITNSLDAKLDAALQALDDMNQNNNVAAINALRAFINSVEAQRGQSISEADADALIATAQQIIASLGG